jgi:carbamoyltransferase
MAQYILGISAFYHDSAVVLLKDGEIVSASHEERFTRKKHDSSFPEKSAFFCLKKAKITASDLEAVVFYDKPWLKFERIIKNFLEVFPRGFWQFSKALPLWLHQKLFIKKIISKTLGINSNKIFFSDHHLSHSLSSVCTSPFKESAVLTLDGVGEFATTSLGVYENNKFKKLLEIHYPHSLGLLYSTITGFLGFKVNSAEYKVMGLAPYGKDSFKEEVRKLVNLYEDGSFSLNLKYFEFQYGKKMWSKNLEKLFGKSRKPETELTQRDFDLAYSLQKLTEEIILNLVKFAKKKTNKNNLCLAGGVALNCVANGKILKSKIFDDIYIKPASGDAGGAIGAAYAYFLDKGGKIINKDYFNPYLGSDFSKAEIKEFLDKKKIVYRDLKTDEDCISNIAKKIKGNNVIGWFQGRTEFGPRALGNRSILADARNYDNWQKVNLKIKFREDFRPFAPTCLEEELNNYFDLKKPSPYMLLTAQVKSKNIPAVTHKDNSARIQTINEKQNPKYYKLIKKFYELTSCPVIINTSFNVRSEPIVNSPEDAFNTFINTEMDYLVLDNFIIKKTENLKFVSEKMKKKHLAKFVLD